MTTRDVLEMLGELARLTALDEGSPQSFKVRAYENAIGAIEGAGTDVTTMSKAELTAMKGIGGSTADKILEFVATGKVKKLESLRGAYPPAFVELTRIPGLGPKTLKVIRAELGVQDLEGLRAAIDGQRLRELPGLGKTSEEKIARAIERLGLHGKDRRTPIVEALPLATTMAAELETLEGVTDVMHCGSLRRFSDTIGDIDIVVATTDSQPVMDFVAGHRLTTEVVGHGETKTSILTRGGLQIDVRAVAPEHFGSAILYFTGSKAHNIALRQRAIDRGWLLNEYGLLDGDRTVASRTEEEIYAALDLPWIPPPLREATGEIDAAAQGLPELVELADIRGDLHYHTDLSGDGRSTLEQMVKAAVERGYEYVAVTDHGEDLAINGSTRDEMLAHRDRIRDMEQKHGIRLYFGCELNIGANGSLDYDAEFRAMFEFCVASIHSHFDLDAEAQTVRILTAISDPAVTAIGHLTGRYIGRRPGIELDVDSVLEGLATTGVALEVNGALDRLDATAEVIRHAVRRDVTLTISTDSHHTNELGRMAYGVEWARRGWAPRASVANTMPLTEFEAWAARRQ
ncbi:MAG TPA: DNA polymerase/3'-5' exonuclease PolX [Acidimicrobiia bacterium]|nr:DNA polymerase/3'-5' exonuclease PolX [Acidimicrobiia bacterium]